MRRFGSRENRVGVLGSTSDVVGNPWESVLIPGTAQFFHGSVRRQAARGGKGLADEVRGVEARAWIAIGTGFVALEEHSERTLNGKASGSIVGHSHAWREVFVIRPNQ